MQARITSASALGTAVVLIALHLIAAAQVQADDDQTELRREFLEGMKGAAKQVEQVALRVRCAMTSEHSVRGKRNEELVIEFGNGFAKMSGAQDRVEFEAVSNPDYAFSLTTSSGRKDFALTWLAPRRGCTPEEQQLIQRSLSTAYTAALINYHLWGRFIFDWVTEPHFTIESLSRVDALGRQLVRVDFDYRPDESTVIDPQDRPFRGYFLCDPSIAWSVVEYDSTTQYNVPSANGQTTTSVGHTHVVIECEYSIGGLPVPVLVKELAAGAKTIFNRTTTIEVLSRDPVKPEEFYLSYYGLPEPNFERSWYGSWLVYLMGGAACLAAAYAVRRRRRAA